MSNNNLNGLNNDNAATTRTSAGNIEFNLESNQKNDTEKSKLNIAPIVPIFTLEQFINAVNTRFSYFKFPVIPIGTRALTPVNFDVDLIDFSSAVPNVINRKLKLDKSVKVNILDLSYSDPTKEYPKYTLITGLVGENNEISDKGSTFTVDASTLSYLDSLNKSLKIKDEQHTIKFKVTADFKPGNTIIPKLDGFFTHNFINEQPTVDISAFLLRLSLDTSEGDIPVPAKEKNPDGTQLSMLPSLALIDKKPSSSVYKDRINKLKPANAYVFYKNLIDDIEKNIFKDHELYWYYTNIQTMAVEYYAMGTKQTEKNYAGWMGRGIFDHYYGHNALKARWGELNETMDGVYRSEVARIFDVDAFGRVRYIDRANHSSHGIYNALVKHRDKTTSALENHGVGWRTAGYKALSVYLPDVIRYDTRRRNPGLSDDDLADILYNGIGSRLDGTPFVGNDARQHWDNPSYGYIAYVERFKKRYNELVRKELDRRFGTFDQSIVEDIIVINADAAAGLRGIEHYDNKFYPATMNHSENKSTILEFFERPEYGATPYEMSKLASTISEFHDGIRSADDQPQFYQDLSEFTAIGNDTKTLEFEYVIPPALLYTIRDKSLNVKSLPFSLHASSTIPCNIENLNWEISVVKCPITTSATELDAQNINKFKLTEIDGLQNDKPYYYGAWPLNGLENNNPESLKEWLPLPTIHDRYTGLIYVSDNTQLLIPSLQATNEPQELPIGNYINNTFIPKTIKLESAGARRIITLPSDTKSDSNINRTSKKGRPDSSWAHRYYSMLAFSDYLNKPRSLIYPAAQ